MQLEPVAKSWDPMSKMGVCNMTKSCKGFGHPPSGLALSLEYLPLDNSLTDRLSLHTQLCLARVLQCFMIIHSHGTYHPSIGYLMFKSEAGPAKLLLRLRQCLSYSSNSP